MSEEQLTMSDFKVGDQVITSYDGRGIGIVRELKVGSDRDGIFVEHPDATDTKNLHNGGYGLTSGRYTKKRGWIYRPEELTKLRRTCIDFKIGDQVITAYEERGVGTVRELNVGRNKDSIFVEHFNAVDDKGLHNGNGLTKGRYSAKLGWIYQPEALIKVEETCVDFTVGDHVVCSRDEWGVGIVRELKVGGGKDSIFVEYLNATDLSLLHDGCNYTSKKYIRQRGYIHKPEDLTKVVLTRADFNVDDRVETQNYGMGTVAEICDRDDFWGIFVLHDVDSSIFHDGASSVKGKYPMRGLYYQPDRLTKVREDKRAIANTASNGVKIETCIPAEDEFDYISNGMKNVSLPLVEHTHAILYLIPAFDSTAPTSVPDMCIEEASKHFNTSVHTIIGDYPGKEQATRWAQGRNGMDKLQITEAIYSLLGVSPNRNSPDILAALKEAFDKVNCIKATTKHIVLFMQEYSPMTGCMELMEKMKKHNVSVTFVFLKDIPQSKFFVNYAERTGRASKCINYSKDISDIVNDVSDDTYEVIHGHKGIQIIKEQLSNKNVEPTSSIRKVDNNMNFGKLFGVNTIGQVKSTQFKSSFFGLAIRTKDNGYVAWDGEKLVDVTDFTFDGDMIMALPAFEVEEGDLVLKGDTALYVKEMNKDGSLVVINPANEAIETYLPKQTPFGFKVYIKIWSMMSNVIPKGMSVGNMSSDNPNSIMLPIMMSTMMSGNAGNTGSGNQNNPMMMMFAMMGMMGNKDMDIQAMLPMLMMQGNGQNQDMMSMLMMSQLMQKPAKKTDKCKGGSKKAGNCQDDSKKAGNCQDTHE